LLKNGQTPSYAFGHGLSYSEFGYRGLRVNDGSRDDHGKHKHKHKHRARRAGHDHGKPPQGDITVT
jgi:hypothetical protein